MPFIKFVYLLLDIGVGNQCRRHCKVRKIGRDRRPMSVNHIEAFALTIKIPGITRLELLFEIKSRTGIVLAGDRQNGLESTVDFGVSGSKKFHVVPTPPGIPTEIVNDALCAAVGFRWDGNINARDLSDLHRSAGSTGLRESVPLFARRCFCPRYLRLFHNPQRGDFRTSICPLRTLTSNTGCACTDGPSSTRPSSSEKQEPCHGHLTEVPSSFPSESGPP